MARNRTYDLTAGRVKWGDISRHANAKACKPWAQKITGTHSKYGVDGDWLDKTTIDGAPHFDVSELEPGDYIKVSGASHSNKKHAYHRIRSVTDETLKTERVDEAEVVEAMESDSTDDLADLRDEVVGLVAECDDEDTLAEIRELIE